LLRKKFHPKTRLILISELGSLADSLHTTARVAESRYDIDGKHEREAAEFISKIRKELQRGA
jgi:hypothetical protein